MPNIEPYKGVRDFYPQDQRIQTYIFSAMRRAVESFGYEEYNASILESTELYTAKTSEEIVNEQTYTFTDRGDRSVTLRPEMTPTVARMVAAKRRDLGIPLRWYCIQNFFRYERPQRGRLREFWQLNVDLFGVHGPEADEEMLVIAARVMREMGATDSMYEIRVNNRELLKRSIESKLKDPSRYQDAVRLIDKRDKMNADSFSSAWAELSDTPLDDCLTSDAGVDSLIEKVRARGIPNVVFSPTLARGFDYYTGMVFEVFDLDPENPRAIAGGGRYDKLIEGYGGEPTPAVGYAMGDVVARDFLETHKLLLPLPNTAHLYLAPIGDSALATKTADVLRSEGINVAMGMKHEKIGDHIKAATKLGITHFAVCGENESASEELAIKDLATGNEEKVSLSKVAEYFLQHTADTH